MSKDVSDWLYCSQLLLRRKLWRLEHSVFVSGRTILVKKKQGTDSTCSLQKDVHYNRVKGAKSLFTWRWGTPGRSGNPLRWGNPPVHIISHMVTPPIL